MPKKSSTPQFLTICLTVILLHPNLVLGGGYVIVDTGQQTCFNNDSQITCPNKGASFYGQDAQYQGAKAAYLDNSDGTVSDLNTVLMWQQTSDSNGDGTINYSDKKTQSQAADYCEYLVLAGKTDWQLPDIKALIH